MSHPTLVGTNFPAFFLKNPFTVAFSKSSWIGALKTGRPVILTFQETPFHSTTLTLFSVSQLP
jgi:hypothetical protein